ncbi:MAG: zf-HC2 domain-containing protein [candidate division NC10 bacterium]
MTCHDARELFSALVDDALSAAERGDLDAHLGGCAECRRELERFQSTVSLLHRVEPARAPAGFVDRVLAAARPVPWHRRLVRAVFLPWPVKLPLEAAALVLVGVTVALLFRGTPELQQAARLETRPPAVSEAPPHPASEPKAAAPESKPAAPAPQPAADQFAAPAPSVADKRDAQESRDAFGKREERSNFRDEADAARRQDAAEAAPAPPAPAPPAPAPGAPAPRAATVPAAPAPAVPGDKKAAEPPGGIVAGRARPSVKESAGADVAAQRLSAARVAPAALDVTGRLSVADRDKALRALADLVAKAGGREVARRALPAGLAIELAIPRAAWPEFSRELARLGRFTPEYQAGELPDDVRVSLRITD